MNKCTVFQLFSNCVDRSIADMLTMSRPLSEMMLKLGLTAFWAGGSHLDIGPISNFVCWDGTVGCFIGNAGVVRSEQKAGRQVNGSLSPEGPQARRCCHRALPLFKKGRNSPGRLEENPEKFCGSWREPRNCSTWR